MRPWVWLRNRSLWCINKCHGSYLLVQFKRESLRSGWAQFHTYHFQPVKQFNDTVWLSESDNTRFIKSSWGNTCSLGLPPLGVYVLWEHTMKLFFLLIFRHRTVMFLLGMPKLLYYRLYYQRAVEALIPTEKW